MALGRHPFGVQNNKSRNKLALLYFSEKIGGKRWQLILKRNIQTGQGRLNWMSRKCAKSGGVRACKNDPVDIVIAINIPQGYSNAMALDQLNQLLTDIEALRRFRLSCSRRTVMMLVKKFSQELLPKSIKSIPG